MSDTQASGPTKKLYDTLSTVRHMPGVTHAIRRLCDDALSEYDEALAARESQPAPQVSGPIARSFDAEGVEQLPAEPAQPAPRTRLEPDGFDYTTGNEVVVNRRVPAQPAGEDLQRDLSDPAYRLEYLKACAKDSDEALEVGVRDVEKAIRTAAQRENEKLRQALADAANEINCAGPVAHRIRMLKEQHQRERVSTDALRKIVEKWRKEAMEFMGEGGIGADIHYGINRCADELEVALVGDAKMSRLDELQHEFMVRHQDADLIECYLAPPRGNGKVIRAVYFSPEYKADQPARDFFRAVRELEDAGGGSK